TRSLERAASSSMVLFAVGMKAYPEDHGERVIGAVEAGRPQMELAPRSRSWKVSRRVVGSLRHDTLTDARQSTRWRRPGAWHSAQVTCCRRQWCRYPRQ